MMEESTLNLSMLVANDDEVAFEAIFKLFYVKLLQFAATILKSREEAEEVVEDVFMKLWDNRKTLPAIKNLNFYLLVAVKHCALNYLEKNKKHNNIVLEELEVEFGELSMNPEESLISSEKIKNIQRIIDNLPAKCKLIFRLIKEDGLKYKEAATLLNLSVKTIEAQMSLALSRIGFELRSDAEYSHFELLQNKSN